MNISGSAKELIPVLYMCVNNPYAHVDDASPLMQYGGLNLDLPNLTEDNPYKELAESIESLAAAANIDLASESVRGSGINAGVGIENIEQELYLDTEEARYLIKTQAEKLKFQNEEIDRLNSLVRENSRTLDQLDHIGNISANLDALFRFEFFKIRFGHMPREAYDSIAVFGIADMDDVFFIPSFIERNEVWGIYFTPRTKSMKVDSMFSVLHFERVRISDNAHGTPENARIELEKEIAELKNRIGELKTGLETVISETKELTDRYYEKISTLFSIYELRKKTVRANASFHLVAWIPERHVDEFSQKLSQLSTVVSPVNSPSDVPYIQPPTLLKNFAPFKPFEQFVKMYGLPSYNETDPTPFLALTYILCFGIMFGDVGQGLVISLIGLLMWRLKRINLGRIMGILGLSSAAF